MKKKLSVIQRRVKALYCNTHCDNELYYNLDQYRLLISDTNKHLYALFKHTITLRTSSCENLHHLNCKLF